MNTAAKGRRREKEFAEMLTRNGFHVMFRSVRVRFQNIDLDNMFDIMASGSNGEKYYVSVKSAYSFSKKKHIAELSDWARKYAAANEHIWLAVRHEKDWTPSWDFEWVDDKWEVIRVHPVGVSCDDWVEDLKEDVL